MSDQQPLTPPWTSWSLSVLNGLFGDYLHQRQNELAIDMAFYHHDQVLPLATQDLQRAYPNLTNKLCILIHGLGCTEAIWQFPLPDDPNQETNYGALLQKDQGLTPFYLRYNTGLAVAENGKRLSDLIEKLREHYPMPITGITMIGHSMGGLVLRSACHYGTQHYLSWVNHVSHAYYLGTPHEGADLERLVHLASVVLEAVPNSIMRLVAKVLNLRSQGVKDLRFGTLLAPDVIDDAPDQTTSHHQRQVPWLAHARHYLVGGGLTDDPDHALTRIFGDGLVASELPAEFASAVPSQNVRLFPGINHFQLAHDHQIYQQIKAWYQGVSGGSVV